MKRVRAKGKAARKTNGASLASGRGSAWSDRREHLRFDVRRQVKPLYVVSMPRSKAGGTTRNLSLGGVGVATGRELKPGDHVAFGLTLPRGRKLELIEGIVKWIKRDARRFQVGIQFTKISLIDKFSLMVFLDRQARSVGLRGGKLELAKR